MLKPEAGQAPKSKKIDVVHLIEPLDHVKQLQPLAETHLLLNEQFFQSEHELAVELEAPEDVRMV